MKLSSHKSKKITGVIEVPGDKSISHRALIISSMAIGRSRISGLLEGEDVINTAKSLRKLGVNIEKSGDDYLVDGVGIGGFHEPDDFLDMGNSGTGARLLMGLVASYNFTSFFTGDHSLRKRPMARVATPLEKIGATIISRDGCVMPLAVVGAKNPIPINYTLPVPSAQVKSAILLAALNIPGITTIIEHEKTRDHTELMLKNFGAKLNISGDKIEIMGQPELIAKDIIVPGDPSSAAFMVVAAIITEDSEITIKNVCVNPERMGLYITLKEMGADIEFINERELSGEKIADIRARSSKLKGITIPAKRAPSMIDEYLVMAVAASSANGETIMQNLAELRVKESNRLQAIYDGMKSCGVDIKMQEDELVIKGGEVNGGALIETKLDHRIAMSFLVLGLVAINPITIDDISAIATSFPNFVELMENIGAKFT